MFYKLVILKASLCKGGDRMKKDNNLKVLKRLLKKKYFSLILLISIHLYIEKNYAFSQEIVSSILTRYHFTFSDISFLNGICSSGIAIFAYIWIISTSCTLIVSYGLHNKHTLFQKNHLHKVAAFRKNIAEILIVLFLLEYFFTLILICQ